MRRSASGRCGPRARQSERYAGLQAAAHWRRALALWPPGAGGGGRSTQPAGTRWSPASPPSCDLSGRPRDAVPVLEAELALAGPAPPVRHRRTSGPAAPAGPVQLLTVRRRIARPAADRARHRGSTARCRPPPGLAAALTWRGHRARVARSTHRGDADVLAEAAAGGGRRPGTASSNARSAPSGPGSSAASGATHGSVDEIERDGPRRSARTSSLLQEPVRRRPPHGHPADGVPARGGRRCAPREPPLEQAAQVADHGRATPTS